MPAARSASTRRRRRPGRIVALEGASGAGKSTTTAALARAAGWVPLAEAYDRLEPRPSLFVPTEAELLATERALLAEESRRWRQARSLAARGRTVLADTGFLGPLTYTRGLVALGAAPARALRTLVRETERLRRAGRWGVPDLVIYLVCPPGRRRARASRDPERHPPSLRGQHAAVGALEGRFYRTAVRRRLGPRYREVRSDRPLARVLATIARIAGSRCVGAPAPARSRSLLADLLDLGPSARGATRRDARRSHPRRRSRNR